MTLPTMPPAQLRPEASEAGAAPLGVSVLGGLAVLLIVADAAFYFGVISSQDNTSTTSAVVVTVLLNLLAAALLAGWASLTTLAPSTALW